RPAYKMPGHRPTENDKRVLIWSGRFKSRDQIPEFVSHEMIDASRNKLRVKACYIMIGLTVLSCVAMVILGKQAAGRNESLLGWNMERKARWREEAGRESTVAAEKAP
ncbi:F162B protein, partial [Amia calva]|nr:F162B protein [Amia calva]